MKMGLILLEIIIVLAAFFMGYQCSNDVCGTVVESVRYDTVIVRDTIRAEVPRPYEVAVVRTDTIFLTRDSVVFVGDVARFHIPVEQKSYATDDYHAVIRGYNPELVSMTVYPQIRTVTVTESRVRDIRDKRFGVGIQAGVGISGQGMGPYIGIGLQYSLVRF